MTEKSDRAGELLSLLVLAARADKACQLAGVGGDIDIDKTLRAHIGIQRKRLAEAQRQER